jgi:NADPH-dependent glutamate synthase beta subunit-like oxidoreductase
VARGVRHPRRHAPITPRDEKVAVVGAGPAGLAVARELATKGYQVTVFDSLPYGGGTMLIGVPAFRLPREAIEMDVRLVERLGVRFRVRHAVGVDITFEQLQRDFDAIAICAGAMDAVALDVPGAELEGVQYGVDFMKKANLGEPLDVGRTSSSSAAATPRWTARARACATAPRT